MDSVARRNWYGDLERWGSDREAAAVISVPEDREVAAGISVPEAWVRAGGSKDVYVPVRVYAARLWEAADPIRAASTDVPVPVLDSKFARGWPKFPTGQPARYRPLDQALDESWPSDAVFAAYSVPGTPHRLATSDAPVKLRGKLKMIALVADVDAHHLPDEERAAWVAGQAPLAWRWVCGGAGRDAHATQSGYHVIERLKRPFTITGEADAQTWRRGYLAWITRLADVLLTAPDPMCSDWTRVYRLPRVVREGARTAPAFFFSSWNRTGAAVLPSPTPQDRRAVMKLAAGGQPFAKAWAQAQKHLAPVAQGPTRQQRPRRPSGGANDLPAGVVDALAAKLALIGDERHPIYLALAGALLGAGIEAARMVRAVEAIARAAGDTEDRVQSRVSDAKSTAEKWKTSGAFTGRTRLRELAPEVAAVLDRELPPPARHDARLRLRELLAAEADRIDAAGGAKTISEARASIRDLMAKCEAPC